MDDFGTLVRFYYRGNYASFSAHYQKHHTVCSAEAHLLASKAFQGLNDWENAKNALQTIVAIGTNEQKIEAELSLATMEMVLQKLSRRNATQLLAQIESAKTAISEDNLYLPILSLRIKASLLVMGLVSTSEKEALINEGADYLFSGRNYSLHHRVTLLQLLMNSCEGNPSPRFAQSIELYKKYKSLFPEDEWMLNLVQANKLAAELKLVYHKPSFVAPASLPDEAQQVKDFLLRNKHIAPDALVDPIYGEHLLELELREGIDWITKGLADLWRSGSLQKAMQLKRKCINWLEERGHLEAARELAHKLWPYRTQQSEPISHDLSILTTSNDFFIKADYASGEKYLQDQIDKITNETNRIHHISLQVNSGSKIARTNKKSIELLEREIQRLDTEDSMLHAQLLSFLAIVSPKSRQPQLFRKSAEIYLETGYLEEAFQQFKNYLSEIAQRDETSDTIEYQDQVQRLDRIFSSDRWIKNPTSTQASILQNIGQTHFAKGSLFRGIEVLKQASDKYLAAHHLRLFAINNQYVILANIQLGRLKKDLTPYNEAREQAEHTIPFLKQNKIADFLWRLYFHTSLCFIEPLRYKLVPESNLDEYKSNASLYLHEALRELNEIHNYTRTLPNDQRIFALSNLSSQANQLISSGFYFFLENEGHAACIGWLEESRNLLGRHVFPQRGYNYVKAVQQKITAFKKPLNTHWFAYAYHHKSEVYIFLFNEKSKEPILCKVPDSEVLIDKLQKLMNSEPFLLYAKKYQVLNGFITPILSHVPEGVPLCIIPYGLLQEVPFHLLGEKQSLAARNPTYYSYSLNLWLQDGQQQNNHTSRIKIFADPNNDLMSAEKEAEFIANLFNVTSLKNNEVSKELFLQSLKENEIVHFAGHGKGTKSENLDTLRLELSNGAYISAQDLINEKNSSGLVVLGSCLSGQHTLLGGEEKASIPYALIISGVTSVLSSRWLIDDEEAMTFFISFYEELIRTENVLQAYHHAYKQTDRLTSTQGLAIYGFPKSTVHNS